MSTVITTGTVIMFLALLAMFVFSRWRLRTIAMVLAASALLYAGVVAWFSKALDLALKRGNGSQRMDSVPHKVVESDRFEVPTDGVGGVRTNAP
jgi:hypothetical protein